MNFRGAIISVGGTPEPIIKTLSEAKPAFILFVASQESKAEALANIIPRLGYTPQYTWLLTPDVGDLADCYERIREGIPNWLADGGLAPVEVYVDITGATKPMSAALAMAGAEFFSHFSYVSGAERNKDGLGVVKSGTEEVLRTVNPWDKLAVRERERSSWLFRHGFAGQSADRLRQAAENCSPELRLELTTLADLAACFDAVDRFRFRDVYGDYRKLQGRLELLLSHRRQLALFAEIEQSAEHWRLLEEERKKGGTELAATLLELLANAERRARQGRYDDAVARLYRAAELFAQGKLWEAFQAKLSKVRRDQVPQEHLSEWTNTFGDGEGGVYELGVRDAFQALVFSQNPAHHEIAERYELIGNHLQKRNNSILAHGLDPCSQQAFEGFWQVLLAVVEVHKEQIIRWPAIDF